MNGQAPIVFARLSPEVMRGHGEKAFGVVFQAGWYEAWNCEETHSEFIPKLEQETKTGRQATGHG